MRKNFKIAQSISIEGEGFYYDLHNNYDFSNLQLSSSNNSVYISFTRKNGGWVPSENPLKLGLLFYGLKLIYFSKNFFINPSTNIEELGYKAIDDENLDWLSQEDKSLSDDHLVFRFDNDEFIRIYAETVEVKQNQ
ncbi:MAG: hypothetical protein JST10_08350 [Bacteroidetes bacterium]|nr:hypothetical protein [Bacteroidota bacterium]